MPETTTMSIRRLSPVLYSLALGAVGIAWLGRPAQRFAPRPPAARAPSCPLPVGQQIKAVKAFAEMMPVFRHPRCQNCHGGLNPGTPAHRGFDQLDPELDPMANRTEYEEQCQTCHDGLPGWRVPGDLLFFVGKDDEELCLQMKRFEHTGEEFVGHIFNDHGEANVQFIAAAFVGDRALGEGLADYHLVAEKPPGSQADLTEKARKWVAAMGGEYVGDPECGCVMPKIKLKVHHTQVFEVPDGFPSKETSEAQFEVTLRPMGEQRPGYYQGEFSLDRTINLTLPPECRGTFSRHERWVMYGSIDPESGAVRVWRSQFADDPTGGIECRHGSGTAEIGRLSGEAVGMLGFGELVIPADSVMSKTLEEEDLGTKESLTITVLEVPPGE